ncbi:protein Bfr2p [[Candida] jaroonii]|uniref:Protein Bfr2p n=1 Tax=[Candida] jaroonii TaxID=467808 RepID=A0ACA9Y769_9ASCO|nr:protein Bfr2p [[Candida] jaroonii]
MKRSLAEELSKIKPVTDFDIENEAPESDEERVVEEGGKDHYVAVGKSKLRTEMPAYGGAKVSRSELFDKEDSFSGSEGSDSELNVNEGSDIEGSDSGADLSDSGADLSDSEESDEEETNGILHKSDSGSEDSEANSEADSDAEVDRSKLKQLMSKERQSIGKRIAQSAVNDALKGYTVSKQNKFFDSLIEVRIKLQKSLTNANLLPVNGDFDVEEDLKSEVEDKCFQLLDNLLTLRARFLETEPKAIKKRKLSSYSDATQTLDNQLNKERSIILNKWSNKVNNSSGSSALNASKFKLINQSAEQQVQNNLNDMERLKKRTFLNRSSITPLGYVAEQSEDEDEEGEEREKLAKNEIKQIFNDEDFYRILLNDLVDKKISNPTSNITLLKTNQKALKNNKNIDTKASKGRKLKFSVQEPISHFETPVNTKWDDYQIDEFFASLLGQKINMAEVESEEDEEEEADDGIRLFS